MKKFLAVLCAVLMPSIFLSACGGGTKVQNDHVLPILIITTNGGRVPVDKVNFIDARIRLYNTENDKKFGFNKSAQIKLRGNSTMNLPKSPYRIKFTQNQSVFGSPANRNWALLADYHDPSLIKNYTALKMAQEFDNMPWNAKGRHVNVYFNGSYRGVYLIADHIDEKVGRLNLETPKDFLAGQPEYPFLVETSYNLFYDDTVDPNDMLYFNIGIDGQQNTNVRIKYPEFEQGRTTGGGAYISSQMQKFLSAISNNDFSALFEICDINSYIDFMLLSEIMSSASTTSYYSKKVGEKIKFGPVWDFDNAMARLFGAVEKSVEWLDAYELNYFLVPTARAFFETMGADVYRVVQARFNELLPRVKQIIADVEAYYNVLVTDGTKNSWLWYADVQNQLKRSIFKRDYDIVLLFLKNHTAYLETLFKKNYNNFLSATYNS